MKRVLVRLRKADGPLGVPAPPVRIRALLAQQHPAFHFGNLRQTLSFPILNHIDEVDKKNMLINLSTLCIFYKSEILQKKSC